MAHAKHGALRLIVASLFLLGSVLMMTPPSVAQSPPPGPYTATCKSIALSKADHGIPVLSAVCQNFYQQDQNTELYAPLSCTHPIVNENGNLRCIFSGRNDPSGQGNDDWLGETTWSDASTKYTYYTIDQPTITRPLTPYTSIKYAAGDTVRLSAGGCAQSGGSGQTWYSYINPVANASEYYGMVELPGTGIGGAVVAPQYIGTPGGGNAPFYVPNGGFGVGYTGFSGVSGVNGEKLYVYSGSRDSDLYLTLGYWDDGWPNNANSGYGDNGYYGWDGGEENQCPKSVYTDPAWVLLEVDHPLKPSTSPAPYSPGSKPFDVIYDQLDGNGLPLNPKWYAEKHDDKNAPDFTKDCGSSFSTPDSGYATAVVFGLLLGPLGAIVGAEGHDGPSVVNSATLASDCTSQATELDQFNALSNVGSLVLNLGSICPPTPIRGHLNWRPVTYTGWLHFSDWSGVYPQDDDINMSLVPGDAVSDRLSGLTNGTESMKVVGPPKDSTPSENFPYGGFLLEFDSTEVMQYLTSPQDDTFWHTFANDALAAGPPNAAAAAFGTGYYPAAIAKVNALLGTSDTKYSTNAVVTGLMGVDGVHFGGIAEIHPVFSIAVHLPGDQDTATGKSEHWAFFIRNQGDEGNCSSQVHTLEPENSGRDYFISLPWPSGASTLQSVSGSALPWGIGGAQTGQLAQTQSSPGVGTYLHFLSPSYSGDVAPSFGFDGEVTLHYTYPAGHQPKSAAPAATSAPASSGATSSAAGGGDAEDFPWPKVMASSNDPAVKTHLQKFLTQNRVPAPAGSSRKLSYPGDVSIVKPKSFVATATLPRRSLTIVNAEKLRQNDELSMAAGYRLRSFQAVDVQHVFVLGTDGVLRLEQGQFAAGEDPKSISSTVIDRGIVTFEAVSKDEVLALRGNGALFAESAPFNAAAGTCVEGFVWRQADANDHLCVSTERRAQVASDNAAGPSHIAPALPSRPAGTCDHGLVWREIDATDHVCVSPEAKGLALKEKAFEPYRLGGSGATRILGLRISKFTAATDGTAMLLDANGTLWSTSTGSPSPANPTAVAKNVRAFQRIDASHSLVLGTDDRLQSYPVVAGSAAQASYDGVWTFQQAGDTSLFVIDAGDTLWREQPRVQIDSNVRQVQALDANTIFVLKNDGTLSLRHMTVTRLAVSEAQSAGIVTVASGIRAFQALDAQTVIVLDGSGNLLLERGVGSQGSTKVSISANVR
jgi:hypothetical protein